MPVGIAAAVFGRARRWDKKLRIGVPAVLVIAALASACRPWLWTPIRRPTARPRCPFDTISIANGSGLFAENCVACHGPQGKGDGVMAKSFAKPPVDMLTEPHTAKHTAGDFFHWLTFGIPDTGMPVFADKLTEEDRWDVVNYLHAMSRGYQARLMSPTVKPEQPQPNMGPPNFSYAAHDGSSGTLKDFRGQKNVLLVLFSWPQSTRAPAGSCASSIPGLPRPTRCCWRCRRMTSDAQELAEHCRAGALPGGHARRARDRAKLCPVPQNALETRSAGRGHPAAPHGIPGGPLRLSARALDTGCRRPRLESRRMLLQQLAQLNREKEILPPPGDHVH